VKPLRGVYAITAQSLFDSDDRRLDSALDALFEAPPRLLQYRDKRSTAERRLALARRLRQRCHAAGCGFIVNDDVELALAVAADGVHLGRSDGSVRAARDRLGTQAIIGVSCSGSLERAWQASHEGASYVAFGRFYDSVTKPDAPLADIAVLRESREALPLPRCAIGGITPLNATPLIEAGADLIAVVDGLFGAADIADAARRYAALFATVTSGSA
jgi:thiamine-phosphate pyrophosphorylase